MRAFAPLVLLLLSLAPTSKAVDFKLYATFTEDTRVELSDGAVWMMDKGDVFPVEAYKNMQKNIVLRLAGATFMTETAHVRILKPDEVAAGIETYRKNVRAYLESTSKKIEDKLKESAPKGSAEKNPEDGKKAPSEEPKAAEEKKTASEEKKP